MKANFKTLLLTAALAGTFAFGQTTVHAADTDSASVQSSNQSSTQTSTQTSTEQTAAKKQSTNTKNSTKKKASKKPAKKTTKLHKTKYQPYADPADMRKQTGDYWKYSSETRTKRPNLHKVKNLNLRVSIKGNRVYVRSGNKVLYTMYSSAGRIVDGKSLTPTGTYRTDSYHPYRFASAYYPVGWKGQLYLFHSVPTYEWSSKFILSEAKKVGRRPASHGCVRLTVADAKWLHYHVPYGTKVIIRNN